MFDIVNKKVGRCLLGLLWIAAVGCTKRFPVGACIQPVSGDFGRSEIDYYYLITSAGSDGFFYESCMKTNAGWLCTPNQKDWWNNRLEYKEIKCPSRCSK